MSEYEEIPLTVCPWDIPDCYAGVIPGQQEDTEIHYYIQAADNSGRLETLPMAGYYAFSAVGGTVFADGDVNMDEVINVLDIILTVNAILGTVELSSIQEDLADMNDDGLLNILDVIMLVNSILGE